jgi:hypothetical protein
VLVVFVSVVFVFVFVLVVLVFVDVDSPPNIDLVFGHALDPSGHKVLLQGLATEIPKDVHVDFFCY